MEPTFIPDGYTEAGYIARVPLLHGAVEFEYRPTAWREKERALTSKAEETPEAKEKRYFEVLKSKVKSWDIKHPTNGDTMSIADETLRGLHSRIIVRMVEIVLGLSPRDLRPGEEVSPVSGSEQAAADLKN